MHELSLMEQVRQQALAAAAAAGAKRIALICLRVGDLSGVEPEALRFAFPVVMQDTIASDAQLRIETEAAICDCEVCRRCFQARDGCCDCPQCGTISRRLRSGRELRLVALEVD